MTDLQNNNFSNPTFLIFILAVHDKINRYSEAYISDKNEKIRAFYKSKIIDYHCGEISIVNRIKENGSDDSILFKSIYIKIAIINIFFLCTNFCIKKNMKKLRNHPYEHICGCGSNGCLLHYVNNNQELKDDQLILMGMG